MKLHRRRLAPLGLAAFLAACGSESTGGRPGRIKSGELLPSADLTDLNGRRLTLGQLAGNPIVVNFWASWCGPCRLEMPEFERVLRSGAYPELAILAINVGEGVLPARQFVDELGLTIPVALDPLGHAGRLLGQASLPVTVFADSTQHVTHIRFGLLNEQILLSNIEEALR